MASLLPLRDQANPQVLPAPLTCAQGRPSSALLQGPADRLGEGGAREEGRRGRGGGRPSSGKDSLPILGFWALQIPAASARAGWAAEPGSEVGWRWVLTHVLVGVRPCRVPTAPRKRAYLCPTCSLTDPALALLAGKSLKTLMSKGILQVHPPICDCPGCRISSPVVRCGRKSGASGASFPAQPISWDPESQVHPCQCAGGSLWRASGGDTALEGDPGAPAPLSLLDAWPVLPLLGPLLSPGGSPGCEGLLGQCHLTGARDSTLSRV